MRTPIIMESEVKEVQKKVLLLQKNHEKRVQLDIGDGMYSDWMGISPSDLGEIDFGKLEIEIHLLVDDPVEWISESCMIHPQRIIGQIERMGSQMYFLDEVEKNGVSGGLALAIDTPISAIEEEALLKAKVLLLLAVPAGTSGSKFDTRVVKKIVELREKYRGEILVDGGINAVTEEMVLKAGADSVAVNSAYWSGEFK